LPSGSWIWTLVLYSTRLVGLISFLIFDFGTLLNYSMYIECAKRLRIFKVSFCVIKCPFNYYSLQRVVRNLEAV
jgi:hypothetical protein